LWFFCGLKKEQKEIISTLLPLSTKFMWLGALTVCLALVLAILLLMLLWVGDAVCGTPCSHTGCQKLLGDID